MNGGESEGREVGEGWFLSCNGGAKPVPNVLQLTKKEHYTQNAPILVYPMIQEQFLAAAHLSVFLHQFLQKCKIH